MVMLSFVQVFLICLAISFTATFAAVPFIIRNSLEAGMTGKDQNKPKNHKPVAEMGGIAIVFGTSLGIISSIALGFNLDLNLLDLLSTLATLLMMGFLGMVDDVYALRRLVKAPIPFISAIPLSAARVGVRTMHFPLIGTVDLGSFYQLAAIPLGVGGASNAFNMLAGLNGLEAGMGIIIAATIAVAAYSINAHEALIISACLAASLIAFYWFNRHPSRIFPGDVGTYTIGATLAIAVIVGNMEFLGVVLFLPYFLEFALKARTRFLGRCFGDLRKDGKLYPPKRLESLTHVVMKLRPMKEQNVVYTLLAMEAVIAIVGLYFFIYPLTRH